MSLQGLLGCPSPSTPSSPVPTLLRVTPEWPFPGNAGGCFDLLLVSSTPDTPLLPCAFSHRCWHHNSPGAIGGFSHSFVSWGSQGYLLRFVLNVVYRFLAVWSSCSVFTWGLQQTDKGCCHYHCLHIIPQAHNVDVSIHWQLNVSTIHRAESGLASEIHKYHWASAAHALLLSVLEWLPWDRNKNQQELSCTLCHIFLRIINNLIKNYWVPIRHKPLF